MSKYCIICNSEGKYKCPTCLVYYCSVQCCKQHRENACDVLLKSQNQGGDSTQQFQARYTSEDTVDPEKLQLLRHSDDLKSLLDNPHLRDLLLTVNSSKDPETIMQMAMQEPLFVEFADVCLKIVEPRQGE